MHLYTEPIQSETSALNPIVRTDKGKIRREIINVDLPWDVDDLVYGDYDPRPGWEYILVGSYGACVLTETFKTVSLVAFAQRDWFQGYLKEHPVYVGDMQVVDADQDGVCEYYSWRCPFGGNPKLLDHFGNLKWCAFEPINARHKFYSSFGDLDGDGRTEFCIQLDSSQPNITVLDCAGNVQWSRPLRGDSLREPSWILGPRMPDIDDDGESEIVASNGESVFIYNGDGAVVKTITLPDPNDISLLNAQIVLDVNDTEDCILAYDKNDGWKFYPLRYDGQWLSTYNLLSNRLGPSVSAYVSLLKNERYIVNLTSPTLKDLHIPGFNPSGRVHFLNMSGEEFYQELLPAFNTNALCVVDSPDGRTQSVILAGGGKLYRYTAR